MARAPGELISRVAPRADRDRASTWSACGWRRTDSVTGARTDKGRIAQRRVSGDVTCASRGGGRTRAGWVEASRAGVRSCSRRGPVALRGGSRARAGSGADTRTPQSPRGYDPAQWHCGAQPRTSQTRVMDRPPQSRQVHDRGRECLAGQESWRAGQGRCTGRGHVTFRSAAALRGGNTADDWTLSIADQRCSCARMMTS
jgi:hypothetical protein